MSTTRTVPVRESPIELSQFLKFAGVAGTGGEAKHLVSEGLVSVNDVVETRRGRKLVVGDKVTCNRQTLVVAAGR